MLAIDSILYIYILLKTRIVYDGLVLNIMGSTLQHICHLWSLFDCLSDGIERGLAHLLDGNYNYCILAIIPKLY